MLKLVCDKNREFMRVSVRAKMPPQVIIMVTTNHPLTQLFFISVSYFSYTALLFSLLMYVWLVAENSISICQIYSVSKWEGNLEQYLYSKV